MLYIFINNTIQWLLTLAYNWYN